jgi:rRNA maturation protein Nop10
MITWRNECPNFNHGRPNAPVRFCPECGEVVNENIPIRGCNEEEHAKRRRERNKYCVHCSEQLMQGI